MTEEKKRQLEAGAIAIARRNVAMAMARQGRPASENPLSYMPSDEQVAVAPVTATATATGQAVQPVAAPAPTQASEPVNPWRKAVDRANGKMADKPKTSAWSAAVARINARMAAE